ncbi:MAG: M17 family peptidase N-terminal domain-containing protein, partial [Gammaproteobacteria bacterium]
MKFSLSTKPVLEESTHCLVLPVVDGKKLPAITAEVDKASRGAISAAIKAGDVTSARGKAQLLRSLSGIASERVLLVGCGKTDSLDSSQFIEILQGAAQALKQTGCASVSCYLTTLAVKDRDPQWNLAMAVQTFARATYRFSELKSSKPAPAKLKRVALNIGDTPSALAKTARQTITIHAAIADGVDLARDLGNRPGNICTPVYLAEQAKQLAGDLKLKINILDEAKMSKEGMGSLLSVGRGSREESRLIVL